MCTITVVDLLAVKLADSFQTGLAAWSTRKAQGNVFTPLPHKLWTTGLGQGSQQGVLVRSSAETQTKVGQLKIGTGLSSLYGHDGRGRKLTKQGKKKKMECDLEKGLVRPNS